MTVKKQTFNHLLYCVIIIINIDNSTLAQKNFFHLENLCSFRDFFELFIVGHIRILSIGLDLACNGG